MKLDPMLDVAKRAAVEDALARLDEYKAADMDAAFAKFDVKARDARRGSGVGSAGALCAPHARVR